MLTTSLHASWRHVMTLSRFREGEKVIMLGAQSGSNQYKSIALQVSREMAVKPHISSRESHKLPKSAVPALKSADLLIDLSHAHDPLIRQLGQDGTRTLTVLEPPSAPASRYSDARLFDVSRRRTDGARWRRGSRRPTHLRAASNGAQRGEVK